MHWTFYIRKGCAYIPATVRAEAGFYVDDEPVSVVPIDDGTEFAQALTKTIGLGNRVVTTPPRDSKPVVLQYAGSASWSRFEKEASCWLISEKEQSWRFGPYRRRDDRGWEEDPERITKLPPHSNIDDVVLAVVRAV